MPAWVQVTVENSAGQRITSSTDTITVALSSNPAGATLGGTLPVAAINGVATFSDLSINLSGNGFTLVASDTTTPATTPATVPATSISFHIDALPAFNSQLSFTRGVGGAIRPDSLITNNAGHLYGTTFAGGLYGDGTVFERSGAGYSTQTTVLSFTGTMGAYPGIDPNALTSGIPA